MTLDSVSTWVYIYIYIVCVCVRVCAFTSPSTWAVSDTRSIFKWCLTGLNSEFSFSLTGCIVKAEEPNLSYYLPIAGEKIIRFIHFPRVLACEMQAVSLRIWTCVTVSISYDVNHHITAHTHKQHWISTYK